MSSIPSPFRFSNHHSPDDTLHKLKKMTRPKSIIKMAVAAVVPILTTVLISGCAGMPMNHGRPVVNNTGANIVAVFIRNTGTADWGAQQQQARTTQVRTEGGGTRTVYATDWEGRIIYDPVRLAHGGTYQYRFQIPRAPTGEIQQMKTVDVKFIDERGFAYGKNRVDLALVERIVITQDDAYPILTMQNNTGFPINVLSPRAAHVEHGGSTIYQVPELRGDNMTVASYSISGYRFDKEVALKNHVTLQFTDRPPTITVQNNTGYPITINSPFSETVANGSRSKSHPKSLPTAARPVNDPTANQLTFNGRPIEEKPSVFENSRQETKQIISYNSGTFIYNKEIMIGEEDVILTLTEKDRPPIVTLMNNTGNTINLVFLRNPGSAWPDQNMLTIRLNEDGTVDRSEVATQSGERRGSFTNRETFRFWLGNITGLRPDRYDIRIDDVQGAPYVKNNVHITEDVTLEFTQEDKP